MTILFQVLYYLLFIYWLLLLARLVVELVRSFAREWRPTGLAVVVIEIVFTATDPPIRALRRVLPPIPLGPVRLDLSLMIVMIVVLIAMQVVSSLSRSSASALVGLA
ncbi:YggT family protein [Gordonia sp. HNM0687]|uniref:YggT family protein n=1 Tax=Gordonia mangrovi TaxID=2665643 RepID=A0A6L7GRD8_9ACTN|nr:YggT family protein [Gordonia mangrovi]MDY6811276.1 YggT family protein [Actinomycetota bacterium]MXP21128.1 YggT family protein [Gordonia mangrovi]UVF78334.1 YggT family protein [Gordonia mangrovi]